VEEATDTTNRLQYKIIDTIPSQLIDEAPEHTHKKAAAPTKETDSKYNVLHHIEPRTNTPRLLKRT